MKEAIFYTLKRETYGSDYNPMAVTSTNRTKSRYWGRDHNDNATNTRAMDCRGVFESESAATVALARVNSIAKRYRYLISKLREEIARLERQRETEIGKHLDRADDE